MSLLTVPIWLFGQVRMRRRWWLFAVLLVLGFFLFTHKANDNSCIENVRLYGAAELPLNCDVHSITNRIYDPTRFVTDYYNWKGRPVYLAYGYIAGHILMPVAQPIWWVFLKPGAKARDFLSSYGRYFHFHLAFVLLNVFVVLASVRASIHLSEIPTSRFGAIALAVAVASYDLVQAGTFMAHTHLFNMLAAVGAALYAYLGLSIRFQSLKHISLLGLMVGMGILSYPILVILAPAYFVGGVYAHIRFPHLKLGFGQYFIGYCVFAGAVAALPLIWYLLITVAFETRVYMTAQAGQFVWIWAAAQEGHLLSALADHATNFTSAVWRGIGRELIFSAVVLGVLALMGGRKFWASLKDPLPFCLLTAVLGVLIFNYLQGFYALRLHISVIILVYILIARTAYVLDLHKTGAVALLIISGYQLIDAATNAAASVT